jgi:hypothetical protein
MLGAHAVDGHGEARRPVISLQGIDPASFREIADQDNLVM